MSRENPELNNNVLRKIVGSSDIKTLSRFTMISKKDSINDFAQEEIVKRLNKHVEFYKDGSKIVAIRFNINNKYYTIENNPDGVTGAVPDGTPTPIKENNMKGALSFLYKNMDKYEKMINEVLTDDKTLPHDIRIWNKYSTDFQKFKSRLDGSRSRSYS